MTTQIVANSKQVEMPGLFQEGNTVSGAGGGELCHLLNDTMQALLPSIYPILKTRSI